MFDLICQLGIYIKNNIKDFINICFWIFTAILAYKTYRNAKKTLFNPIRSEMVKYQMKIITDFIDTHTSKGLDLDFSIDYFSLVKINFDVDYYLDIYSNEQKYEDYNFEDIDRIRLKYCEENLAGLFEIMKKDNVHYFDSTVTGDFDLIKQYVQSQYIKNKEELNKDLSLQRLYFTKNFYDLYSDLLNLQSNPFIPKEIKINVDNVVININKNLQILYDCLSLYMLEEKRKRYRDIYSHFQLQKISHEKDLKELRNAISQYFKVNNI